MEDLMFIKPCAILHVFSNTCLFTIRTLSFIGSNYTGPLNDFYDSYTVNDRHSSQRSEERDHINLF